MTISKNDPIMVGSGRLYGPPFLSRFLLFRLRKCNRAVLVYHRERSFSASSMCGSAVEMVAARRWPTTAYVQYCPDSALISVENLLKLPATEVPLPKNGVAVNSFDNLTIRIEPFDLMFTEKMIVAYAKVPQNTLKIASSNYHARGPVNISYWPEEAQSRDMKLHCLKVSVNDIHNGQSYNLESEWDWSLTAFDIEEDNLPILEVNLILAKS